MEERINSELESLKVQNQLLETELEIARMRAENAEEELRQIKATIRLSVSQMDTVMDASNVAMNIPLPPPPPPNIPPPPPMPSFNLHSQTNKIRSRSNSQTLSDALSDAQQKLQSTSDSKETTKQATGRKL
jgi:hypothetical protein